METRPPLFTRTTSKTPSTPRLRWTVSENCWPGRRPPLTAANHHAENSDHRDRAVSEARHRATTPASTATKTAWPMVPGWLDGEQQLLRTGLQQGPGCYPQERLVSGRLAGEWQ